MQQQTQDLLHLTESNEDYLKERYGNAYPFWTKATQYLLDKETASLDLIDAKRELEEMVFEIESIESYMEISISQDSRLTNEQSRKAALKRQKQEDGTWVKLSRERIPNQKDHIVRLELQIATLSKMYSLVAMCLTTKDI